MAEMQAAGAGGNLRHAALHEVLQQRALHSFGCCVFVAQWL